MKYSFIVSIHTLACITAAHGWEFGRTRSPATLPGVCAIAVVILDHVILEVDMEVKCTTLLRLCDRFCQSRGEIVHEMVMLSGYIHPSESGSMTDINKDLDEVIVNLFRELDNYASLRQQLDQELSTGFLLMAKSRQHMGQNFVSSLQFDEREMIPQTRVDVSVDTSELSLSSEPASDAKQDTLKMFGVLVPQSLRTSRTCFQRSNNVACQLVNCQTEITKLRTEYSRLQTELNS